MPQQHKCPHCGSISVTSGMTTGEIFHCPACGRDFSIPAVPDKENNATPPPPGEAVSSQANSLSFAARQELASPIDRLLGHLIDYGIAIIFSIPAAIAIIIGGTTDSGWLLAIGIIMAITFNLVYWIFQAYWLSIYGQSIGKKIMRVKIVMYNTGKNGGFVPNVLLREIVNWLISIFIFYRIIDVLFIFSEERRCIHDHIAGTKVVKA